MQKFKIETMMLPLQAQMLGRTLAAVKGVESVDIDRKSNILIIDGEYSLYAIIEAAGAQGINITPL